MSSPANTPRRRPAGLPADARWEPALPGFEQGALDAEGRRHGPYRSWSAEGVLHRACGYEHGVLHGASTTYHPDGSLASEVEWSAGTRMSAVHHRCDGPTPEPFPPAGPKVRSVGCYTRDGRSDYTTRYLDAAGREVGPDGEPLPPRPPSVSPDARWRPDLGRWVDGALERGTDRPVGAWRWWSGAGALLREELRGPDGEPTMSADYAEDGALRQKVTRTAAGEEREHFGASGKIAARLRDDPAGRPIYRGSWREDGTLEAEVLRAYDGDQLASVTERGEGGALALAARREGDALTCVLYTPRGAIRATGQIRGDRLDGAWKLFDSTGELERELDTAPLALALPQGVAAAGVAQALGEALSRLEGGPRTRRS